MQKLVTAARLSSAHSYMRDLYQLSPGLEDITEEVRKECKSQGMGKRAMKCCLLDTPTVLLNSQPLWLLGHDQARQHSSMYGRESQEASLLVEELLTVDGCWGRGNYCSPELCLQVDCPCSGGGLQTHRHAGSANCTQEEEEHREQEEDVHDCHDDHKRRCGETVSGEVQDQRREGRKSWVKYD